MPKSNVCLIGLAKNITDKIGKELAIKLDMFYANLEEIMEFELIDIHNVEIVCGKDYLAKKENSILKRICTYENTLVNIDYSMLNNNSTLEFVKDNCLIIYIRFDIDKYIKQLREENISFEEKQIYSELYPDRDYLCSNMADLVVLSEKEDEKEISDEIFNAILSYYER